MVRYDLCDASGLHVATHVRRDVDGRKEFLWELPSGEIGLGGYPVTELPLFGIHHLGDRPANEPVVVVEGEKAAAALLSAGVLAVGTVTGAWSTPSPRVLAELTGRTVLLWPDNDDPGRDHMRRIGAGLREVTRAVRWIDWADAPPNGDAVEALERGGTQLVAQLMQRAASIEVIAPSMRHDGLALPFREFVARALADDTAPWLVAGVIQDRGLTVFHGAPRSFKTFAALQLACAVSGGHDWLGRTVERTGGVLYVGEEGAPALVAERLDRLAGALPPGDLRLLHRRGVTIGDRDAWRLVEDSLAAMSDPAVVIIDPYSDVLDGDENSAGDQRRAIHAIRQLIREFEITAVVIHHEAKGASGNQPGRNLRGSSKLWASSDSVVRFSAGASREGGVRPIRLAVESKDAAPCEVHLLWDPETFLLSTTAPGTDRSDAGLLSILREADGPLSAAMWAAQAGLRKSAMNEHIRRLRGRALVRTDGSGPSTRYLPADQLDQGFEEAA